MNYRHYSDVFNSRTIGGQLFEVLDYAWQETLSDTGDYFDTRYNSIGAVGLALVTASERPPAPEGGDNPLNIFLGNGRPITLLSDKETSGGGPMRYRYNHRDVTAVLDPTLLGLRRLDQVYDNVLKHGRYPINAAAKRNHLINNPLAVTSFDPAGPAGEFAGELRAAGGIRILGEKAGIVAVSGGNQLHDHVAAAHWAFMAEGVIEGAVDSLEDRQVDVLKIAVSGSMGRMFEHLRAYSHDSFGDNIELVPHEAYGVLIEEANHNLLATAA